jgi:hypothetical protein
VICAEHVAVEQVGVAVRGCQWAVVPKDVGGHERVVVLERLNLVKFALGWYAQCLEM